MDRVGCGSLGFYLLWLEGLICTENFFQFLFLWLLATIGRLCCLQVATGCRRPGRKDFQVQLKVLFLKWRFLALFNLLGFRWFHRVSVTDLTQVIDAIIKVKKSIALCLRFLLPSIHQDEFRLVCVRVLILLSVVQDLERTLRID